MMYRQYEDPRALEKRLEDAKTALEEAKHEEVVDFEWLCELAERVSELEERVNFAWQDDEFEANCRAEAQFYGENPVYDFEPYDCNGIAY